jgi:hypothetical protein
VSAKSCAVKDGHNILGLIAVRVPDHKRRSAEYAKYALRPDNESGFFLDFANDGVSWSFVGLNGSTRCTPDVSVAMT